jgi:hypothetical protein
MSTDNRTEGTSDAVRWTESPQPVSRSLRGALVGILTVVAALASACGGTRTAPAARSGTTAPLHVELGSSKPLDAPADGANLDYSGVAQPFSSPAVVAAVKVLDPGTLRYPGGAIANYWVWQTGAVAQPAQTCHSGATKPARVSTYGFTLQTLKDLVTATGTTPIFDLNVLNSTLSDQMAMLHSAATLGIPVRYVELGNEFYLSCSNYTRVFPTAASYAQLVASWAPQLHAAFPHAEIAAVGSLLTVTSRERTWNSTILSIAGSSIDAMTLHDYSGPVGNEVQPSTPDLLAAADRTWQQTQTVISSIPSRVAIWLTEYNLSEKARSAGSPPVGQTWAHGLYVAESTLLADEATRVELSDYWALFDVPSVGAYTTGADPQLTPAGAALLSVFSAASGATSVRQLVVPHGPTLPGESPGLVGAVFSTPSGTRTVVINLTGQPVALSARHSIPRDAHVEIVAAAPGALAPTSRTAPVGAALDLPAYSIAVAGVAP